MVKAPHKQIKVNDITEDLEAPRDAKTIRSIDLHNKCWVALQEHIKRTSEQAQALKEVS